MNDENYYNLTAAAMYRFLDREAIEQRRYKNSRKFFRSLPSKSLRQFAKALKHEMVHDPECNESNIPQKVMARLKIGRRMYEKRIKKVRETLPKGAIYGGVVK